MPDSKLIELDGRRRASLGKLARHSRYFARVEDDGTIILTPAAVIPAMHLATVTATLTPMTRGNE